MAFRQKNYTDQELLQKLRDGSLPPLAFTHKEHIRLVWLSYKTHGDSKVYNDVRDIIKNYAFSIGEGHIFHETLTYAAVAVVLEFINKLNSSSFEALISSELKLITDFKHLVSIHYSDQLLRSDKAKIEIMEPDLVPF